MSVRDPATVATLWFRGADLFESSIPASVFGVDRTISGAPAFQLLSVAADDGPLIMTSGVAVTAPHGLDALDRAGVVIIPSWRNPRERPPQPVLDAIVRAHHDGALIVSLCMGAFVLAATGLVDGRTIATNWFHAPALQALHSQLAVDSATLFVDHGDVVASAGCAAGIDACLHVVRRIWGAAAALAIAKRMVVPALRSGGQAQFIEQLVPLVDAAGGLADALAFALEHLGEPLDADALATRAGMSRRTFDRRFRATNGTSVTQWLLQQRVIRAQRLLESTQLPIDPVAQAVGMSSALILRPHFRRIIGVTPQRYREAFRLTELHAA